MSACGTNGHHESGDLCPLLGVKRTSDGSASMSAYDPKRTSRSLNCCAAQHSPTERCGRGKVVDPRGGRESVVESSHMVEPRVTRLPNNFRWPGGHHIALIFNIAYEAWSQGKAPGIGPMGNPLPAGAFDVNALSWGNYAAAPALSGSCGHSTDTGCREASWSAEFSRSALPIRCGPLPKRAMRSWRTAMPRT
jgi:hypothetical protein